MAIPFWSIVSRYIMNQYFVVIYIFYSLNPTLTKIITIIDVIAKKKTEKVNDNTLEEIIWQQTPIEIGEAVISIACNQ
jgi:hypothetical protein